MPKYPHFPQGIAAPFPDAPDTAQEADGSLAPEPYLHRPQTALKGRGAVTNLRGRYDAVAREAFDDDWHPVAFDRTSPGAIDPGAPEDDAPPPLNTIITEEHARSILSRNRSPDLPFSLSLNPYRGCEHGCIYCFARPSHSYLGLSPGLDFESRLVAKVNAPALLARELARPGHVPDTITIGINTDAYQPCERQYRLTRQLLQILHDCHHPVAMITKSSLIERDIDLLAPMAARGQAIAAVTLTTLDPVIARSLEPRAAAPSRRLRVIRTLAEAGIPVSVSIAPVIPFVTEPDLERVMEAAVDAGARHAGYILLRLPWEVAPLFRQWLHAHFPDRAARVMHRIQDMRGGKDYDAAFGTRMRGTGIWADLLQQRFEKASRRLGIAHRHLAYGGMERTPFKREVAQALARELAAQEKTAADQGTGGQMPLF